MSASNNNWVCFDCRSAIRQAKTLKRVPKCVECGTDRYCLGYKVEVPKKIDERGWRKLREDCREFDLAKSERERRNHQYAISSTKRQIARLEKLETNKDRDEYIALLKKSIGE